MLKLTWLLMLCFLPKVGIGLEVLTDDSLSRVSGQTGVTIDQDLALAISNIRYEDDGNHFNIDNLSLNSKSVNEFDVTNDGILRWQSTVQPSQLRIGGVRIANSNDSVGQLALDYRGETQLLFKGVDGGGIAGSYSTVLSDAALTWSTNGHSMSFQNIGYKIDTSGFTMKLDAVDNTKSIARTGIALAAEKMKFEFSTGAFSLAGVKLGALAGKVELKGSAEVFAGGRLGSEGFTLHSTINILENPSNEVSFTDDGHSLIMGDFSGTLNLKNLTLDVAADHLAIEADELKGDFKAGRLIMGDATKPAGSIEFDFLFDQSNSRSNQLKLYSGIRRPKAASLPTEIKKYSDSFYSGLNSIPNPQGLSSSVQWNLASANFSYNDNGNKIIISDITSHGSADTTIDIRNKAIAVGVTDLKGSYGISGLKVGNKNAAIQGGAELLLSLEVFQAMDFDIDGYTTISAGGSGSVGGISVDGDYFFSDSKFGLSVDENGQGIWATGVDYDIHLRNLTFDVESDGIRVNRGEQWSTMDIANLRWGDKNNGRSLGRVNLQRFEQNSSLVLKPGGAGDVCIGASATSEAGCNASNGRWEARGEQGLTVQLKAAFADSSAASGDSQADNARNRLTWENNRTVSNGKAVNGSGTQIIFDNFSTNDGLGNASNNYGFQANLSIDVFETKVLKKSNGADSQGKTGSIGDELIYDNAERLNYNYITAPSAAQKALRPLGFAVRGNVSFKELTIGSVQLKHPSVAAEPVFSGVVMQNLDLTTNLTATPIQ